MDMIAELKKTPFNELPTMAKKALLQYWVLEGDVLDNCESDAIQKLITAAGESCHNIDWHSLISLADSEPFFSDRIVRYGELPASAVQAHIMAHSVEIGERFDSFNDYHRWYGDVEQPETYHESWPLLMCEDDYDCVLDGSHRLHVYIDQQRHIIPVLYLS